MYYDNGKQTFCKMFFLSPLRARCDCVLSPAPMTSWYVALLQSKAGLSQQLRQPCYRGWFCFELKQPLILTKSQVHLGIVVLLQTAVIPHDWQRPFCQCFPTWMHRHWPKPSSQPFWFHLGPHCPWVLPGRPKTMNTWSTGIQSHSNRCFRMLDEI